VSGLHDARLHWADQTAYDAPGANADIYFYQQCGRDRNVTFIDADCPSIKAQGRRKGGPQLRPGIASLLILIMRPRTAPKRVKEIASSFTAVGCPR